MQLQQPDSWKVVPALLVAYALQTTWLAHLQFVDAHCNLVLLVAVFAALQGGVHRGAWAGFYAGLLLGYGAGWHLGSFLVSHIVAAGTIGFFPRKFSQDNPLAPLLCAALAAVIADVVFWLMAPTDFPVVWWLNHIWASVVLQTLLAYPVHLLLRAIIKPPRRLMFA